ncbi:SymE family type I addiction module toxin [Paraburkholderia pallida]|uniref:Type I toxin-antitoxin system SymE family toxin n=1 Tax=Paraburkholderia pallida TaxID=2547399 RepID=A0A4V1AYK5_9BURK|nr:type I toxin-antitoxin system SymE family toxin [Paraburkholderia pallida]
MNDIAVARLRARVWRSGISELILLAVVTTGLVRPRLGPDIDLLNFVSFIGVCVPVDKHYDAILRRVSKTFEQFAHFHQHLRFEYRRINARTRTAPPLYPWIKLAGRWLELAGFEAGQRVKVEVQHGRLVITQD